MKALIEEHNQLSKNVEDRAVRGKTKAKFQKQHKETQARIESFKGPFKNCLKPCMDPIANSIEAILDTHGLSTQAYHGGTLYGNHANKYIKP